MRAWLLRLLGADRPPPPRLQALADRLSDVELGLENVGERLEDSVKAINARITNKIRSQDAPGEAIEPEASPRPTAMPTPVRRIRRNY